MVTIITEDYSSKSSPRSHCQRPILPRKCSHLINIAEKTISCILLCFVRPDVRSYHNCALCTAFTVDIRRNLRGLFVLCWWKQHVSPKHLYSKNVPGQRWLESSSISLRENIFSQKLYCSLFVLTKCTFVQALRLCTGRTVHRGSRGIGKGTVHRCTGTEALYRPYGP